MRSSTAHTLPLRLNRRPKPARTCRPRDPAPDLELIAVDPELRKSIEVLVIDDEHSLRESCASLLRTEGFSRHRRADGATMRCAW